MEAARRATCLAQILDGRFPVRGGDDGEFYAGPLQYPLAEKQRIRIVVDQENRRSQNCFVACGACLRNLKDSMRRGSEVAMT